MYSIFKNIRINCEKKSTLIATEMNFELITINLQVHIQILTLTLQYGDRNRDML